MKVHVPILLAIVFATASLADQTYPGTLTRPILSDDEAEKYTQNNYFSGWEPEEIVIPNQPDYIVKADDSIQAVVNEAIINGSPAYRTYIRIEPGMYMETVYIKGNVPLTIYGGGDAPDDVHIMGSLSASATPEEYRTIVNSDGKHYQEGDPAWSLYNACANKKDIIETECTAVFWVASDGFQLQGVKIHNGATDAQAVAIKTSADKIHLMNNHFLGVQDTVGLGIETGENNEIQRVLVHMCNIEGEIDYVFGGAAAVFKMVTFNTVATKDTDDLVIFAPDTSPARSYGFLVINSDITGDVTYSGSNKIRLGRSWDHGIKSEGDYVPGESPNGQLVIRDTQIDNSINIEAPYASAATSKRPFSTNINSDRDLDDNNYNRLWEYNNQGSGS